MLIFAIYNIAQMKVLKIIFFIITISVTTLFVVAFFIDSNYSVEESILIEKNKLEVFDYIKYLKNRNQYAYQPDLAQKIKTKYKKKDGRVGFTAIWKSESRDVESRKQKIVNIEYGKSIDYDVHILAPFESIGKSSFQVKALTDSTVYLTSQLTLIMKYPNNLSMLFLDIEKETEDKLHQELKKIKEIVEQQ